MPSVPAILRRVAGALPAGVGEPEVWRKRAAMLVSALLIGLAAVLFAWAGDFAQGSFTRIVAEQGYSPLILTPFLFLTIAALTRSLAPEAPAAPRAWRQLSTPRSRASPSPSRNLPSPTNSAWRCW